jgi:eukaryotic-like serine/threonine-protein kinase
MNPHDRWSRMKTIFEDAMAVPPDRRNALLDEACAGDPVLRAELQELVNNCAVSTAFLGSEHRERMLMSLLESHSPIFAVDDVIGGRYRAIRFLAQGGMGQVYQVEDQELKTTVALKALFTSMSLSAHRVRREILLARTVTHPNVCRVFDVGHHAHTVYGDMIFLTMELLDGETLRGYLDRCGALTCEQVKPLLKQITAALSAAHQLGVIHRDLKPGNIMLVDYAVTKTLKVTDFGLAKRMAPDEATASSYGEICGTPDYMAPEQFRGQYSKETDIYALGLIICEMLTGKLPASRTRPFEAVQQSNGKQIDPQWQSVATKCLAAESSERFHDVEEVWAALSSDGYLADSRSAAYAPRTKRSLATAAAILLLVLTILGFISTGVIPNPFIHLPEQKHIAVLPFENLGNDSSNQAFADGLVESLTSKLSQLERYQKSFWIVPSKDSRKVRSLDDASRNLNVNLAVTGSIQRTADGVNLTANLIDAKRHKQLASRAIHVSSANMDTLQSRVWEAVADMLDVEVNRQLAQDIAAGGTADSGAFDLYEQGIGYLQLEKIDSAVEMFTKALSKDSQYALAYAGLGDAYAEQYFLTKDPQWIEKGTWNARHAIQLDDRLVPAHLALGKIYQHTGQLDDALIEFRRVLDEDPASVEAEYSIAEVYRQLGKTSEAEAAFKALIDRRPWYWGGYSGLGTLYYHQGDFTKAVQQFKATIDLSPDNPIGYQDLGGAYLGLGRYLDAIGVLETALNEGPKKSPTMAQLDPERSARAWANLGAAYMYVGRYQEAVDATKKATDLEPHNDVLWRNLGDGYRQIPGEEVQATQAYQKALAAAEDQLNVNPKDFETVSGMALYQAHLGQHSEAAASIAKARSLAPKDSDVLFTSALVYEIIGQRQKALTALDEATKAGYSLEEIEQEPELKALRKDPRYQRWLRNGESKVARSNT